MPWLKRTRLLLGAEALEKVISAKVCVIGLGAVGSYAVEGLARAGVGGFRLVDFDEIKPSNLNRQLYALNSTLGGAKTALARKRILDINPAAAVEEIRAFAHADTLDEILAGNPDIVIDAVDSLAPKVEIIAAAAARGLTLFSAMGAATRSNPEAIRFGPLFTAKGCPLARLVRKRLRKRGVDGDLWCVYSDEPRNLDAVVPADTDAGNAEEDGEGGEYERGRRRDTLGSLSTITGMFGLRLAHEAILRLARTERE